MCAYAYRDDEHFFCTRKNHGVDITEAEQVFDLIGALKNDYVTQIVRRLRLPIFLQYLHFCEL